MIKRLLHRIKTGAGSDATLAFSGHPAGPEIFSEIDRLSDAELQRLNSLLPWSSWIVDSHGRRFGTRFNESKRAQPETIPDRRIIELGNRIALDRKHVVELGCFEGNHTIALSQVAERVTAIDSRIENVVKTIVRCALAGCNPKVHCWDVEQAVPMELDLTCDVLHHVGVLYHLRDPVGHLRVVSELTRETIMLDTHVAPDGVKLEEDQSYHYWEFKEHGRNNPFAGMYDHAKWIVLADLVRLLNDLGFSHVDVAEKRKERNGPRVLIFASR